MSHYLNNFRERHQDDLPEAMLDKKIIELSALIEISQSLNSTLNLKSILDNILLVPMGRMMVSRGVILFNRGNGSYRVESVKGLAFSLIGKELHISNPPEHPVNIHDEQIADNWVEFFKTSKINFLIPLSSSRDFNGLLGFGDKINGKPFDEEESEFLVSLGNIAVQAIENALTYQKLNSVNRELDGKIQELNTLFEIGSELNRLFDKDKILRQLSYSLMGQLLINQFFVLLFENNRMRIAFHKGSQFTPQKLEKCMEMCSALPELPGPIKTEEEGRYASLFEMGIRAIVPMMSQNKIGGYIFLGEKLDKNQLIPSDLEFLSTLANMAMSSLDNARLFKDMLEKERLEEEMHLAQNIQEQLLPSRMPSLIHYDIKGINIPSKTVGGDYYDIIQVDDHNYIFTIADVSGKGMPASLLMSNLQAGLKTLAMEKYPLAQMTARLNNLIFQNTTVDKYITFFLMKLNIDTGAFEYVNAGHNPPYWLKNDDTLMELDKGGIILGMMKDMPYETGNGILQPGDRITMYTDGVTEAMDPSGKEFEESGLIRFLEENRQIGDSEKIVDRLIALLKKYTAGALSSYDDVTILTIQRIAD